VRLCIYLKSALPPSWFNQFSYQQFAVGKAVMLSIAVLADPVTYHAPSKNPRYKTVVAHAMDTTDKSIRFRPRLFSFFLRFGLVAVKDRLMRIRAPIS
jgi:hypothetical protein